MVRLIYGEALTGKSSLVYKSAREAALQGKDVMIIVPEQQVLETESAIYSFDGYRGEDAPQDGSSYIDVLSFKRLCNDIFRKYGGISYKYIGEGGKSIVMWRAISSVSDLLCEYKNISLDDMSSAESFVATVNEFKMYNITPEALAEAAEKTDDHSFGVKLNDLAVIFTAYNSLLSELYDDPSDDLTRAAALLEGKNFFNGKTVFIDSFDGYTLQQALMLERIFSECEDITITLGYTKSTRREMTSKLKATDRLIRKLLDRTNRAVSDTVVLENGILRRGEITYLSKNIWDYSAPVYEGDSSSVRIIECADAYEEAEFIASDIKRLLQCGARYKEIAVIARDTSSYEGIIDTALDTEKIPYFFSHRVGIMSMPEVRMILSALSVHARGWRIEDVISYMRCGLSGLSSDECDVIEDYVSVWRISGRRWYDKDGWTMNPDGYTTEWNDTSREELKHLNILRETLVKPLYDFSVALSNTHTVVGVSTAIYNYLSCMKVREKLSEKADAMAAMGEDALAGEAAMAWNSLMRVLDDIVGAAGDIPIDVSEYISLFRAVVSKEDIGHIPSRRDEVIFASANLSRKNGIKYVYVIGLEEGNFPLNRASTGLLSELDKEKLSALGIETSLYGDEAYFDEQLFFYKAVSSATELVTLSYAIGSGEQKNAPSSAIQSAKSLFNDLKTIRYKDIPYEDKIYSLHSALDYASQTNDKELIRRLEESGLLTVADAFSIPFDASGDVVSPMLGRKKMSISHSRIEPYVKCPFSYHCKYALKLSEEKSGAFGSLDVGVFIHKILERYFSEFCASFKEIKNEDIKELSDRIVDDFARELWNENVTPRIKSLIKRLKRLSTLLIKNITEEFRQSDFVPLFFELPISSDDEKSEEMSVKAQIFDCEDGLKVSLNGVVDRVDVYKDGEKAYIRVIDYKTGTKSFSLDEVRSGLGMQMLIYLFAICWGGGEKIRKMLDVNELIPAGVLYIPSKMPEVNFSSSDTKETDKIDEKINAFFKRNGYLLKDIDVLRAMEHSANGIFMPASSKDVNADISPTLYTIEELGRLKNEIEMTVSAIASGIAKGRVSATPMKTGNIDACKYCSFKPFCRVTSVTGVKNNE